MTDRSSGPDADRIAELERERGTLIEANSFGKHNDRLAVIDAELACLRNEQGTSSGDPPYPSGDQGHGGFGEHPCPAPSPEPQDVLEALKMTEDKIDIVEHYIDEVRSAFVEIAKAALAQSDAQPVGWQEELEPGQLRPCPFCGKEAKRVDDVCDGGSIIECSCCHASTAVHYDRKESLYSDWNERTAPHRPDASRLIEGREELQQDADRWRAFLNGIPRNSESKRLLIQYADAIRSRAADKSAPRSDKGGA